MTVTNTSNSRSYRDIAYSRNSRSNSCSSCSGTTFLTGLTILLCETRQQATNKLTGPPVQHKLPIQLPSKQ